MNITLPLKQMSTEEKLQVMEAIFFGKYHRLQAKRFPYLLPRRG